MAARIVPAIYCPLPTFSGSKKEDLLMFIEAIDIAHQEKRALYDNDETALRAKKSLLMQACKSKAARYIKGLDQDKKDTWDHLVAALTEKYNAPNVEDRAKAYHKAMKLKQKSDEELGTYAKRAKKLAKKVDPALDKAVAMLFAQGIRSKRLRMMVAVTSQSKSDYTFRDVYQAVRAIARAREEDSDSESDSSSSSSSSTDSSAEGGSRHHHHRREEVRKAKEPKVTEVEEVKRSNPASTQFNMDDIAKFIKENVQASTRKVVGSYALASGPGPVFGQPPQAPMIESDAVSSQSRPQFSGRTHPYQQSGGFQCGFQQQPGGQGGHQQPGGYQQSSGQQFGGQQRYQPPYRRSTNNSRSAFMEQYAAQDTRSSGQPQAPTTTTSQNPKVSEISLVEDMGFSSSALDGVTVANADFTDVSMIEEIFAVEKRKVVLSGPDSDGSDSRIAKNVAQDPQQDTQQAQFAVRGSAEARESATVGGPSASQSATVGGPSASQAAAVGIYSAIDATAGGEQRECEKGQTRDAGTEEEKEMAKKEKDEKAGEEAEKQEEKEQEKKSSGEVEKEMVGEDRVEDGEKRMEVLVVDKGVEEENAVDGQRSGRKGAELLVKKKGMEAEEKEKEELGVRGTVMHGVHDSALFYSMDLLQFIVEWGYSMLVVWRILRRSGVG
jgi:hypothetical protein